MIGNFGQPFGFGRRLAIAGLLLLGAGHVDSPVRAQSVVAAASPALMDRPATSERAGSERLRTRFVIGLERPVEFQVFALSNPNRVYVELPDVKMLLPQAPEAAIGLVKSFRGGMSAPGKSRIVIDVVAPVMVERANIEKDGRGHRLVLDIAPVETPPAAAKRPIKATVTGSTGVQPPLPKPAMRPQDKAAKSFKPLVVIDPGHGGHDSGATKNGIVEKDAVLAFSKALKDKLVAGGRYRVLMTRDSDLFVPLDERRAFAERNKAALFIAVHADYAGSHARGATIYSLTDSTADSLRRSAKGEVSGGVLTGKELTAVQKTGGDVDGVKTILADLAQREVDVNKERTNVIAKSIIAYMGASTSMRENADREANFRVLMTAQVPAVLIELAYVTNAQDAQNLKSEKWRDKVSSSISTAVDNYFANQIARLPM
jgi:N-acetylmuramoyl-L-alanine amidase